MDLSLKLLSIFALIVAAAYFAISEISLAGSRRVRLTQMVENGDKRAQEVINLQEKPGPFFSVIQIGINAVAILGGIVGEAAFTDVFAGLFKWFVPAQYLETTSFLCSFLLITMLFIIFADLLPKRIGLTNPEKNFRASDRLNASSHQSSETVCLASYGYLQRVNEAVRSSDPKQKQNHQ